MLDKTEGRLYPEDINIERILAFNEAGCDAWRDCTGDLFWSANPLFNFRWLAAALGAQVMAGGESVWVEPFLKSYDGLDDLVHSRRQSLGSNSLGAHRCHGGAGRGSAILWLPSS